MTTIKEITNYLENIAPISSQESYDNSGLIVGNPSEKVTGILVSLDCTEEVVEEAIAKKCNLIVAHHPIVFGGLKKINGKNYVERTVLKAIKNNIAIYAIHTNLDNAFNGVNAEIAKRLNLVNTRVLQPKEDVLTKLIVYVPETHTELLKQALFEAGAGEIGKYGECSFTMKGVGTYKPLEGSNPFEGTQDKRSEVQEDRVEVLVSTHKMNKVLQAMFDAHPYEEVAYELVKLHNVNQYEGAGMIGELSQPMDEKEFLQQLKTTFNCGVVRHTKLIGKPIEKVAVCGGAGSFLLKTAIGQQADIYITGDMKYHEFFDAENHLVIADIGHYESEQYTSDLLTTFLKTAFTSLLIHRTELTTNPIHYL